MKTNTIKALLLFFILSFSQIVESSEKIKYSNARKSSRTNRIKSNRKTKTITKSKGILNEIWKKITEFMKDPKNILFFLLGAASAWISEAEDIYKFLKESIFIQLPKIFSQCKNTFWDPLFKIAEEKALPESISISGDWENMKKSEKSGFCKNMKTTFINIFNDKIENFRDFFSECLDKTCSILTPWKLLKFSYDTVADFSTGNYCNPTLSQTKQMVTKKWKTYENYQRECEFFRDMNCDDPEALETPAYGAVMDFVSKSYNFYEFINTGIKCIKGVKEFSSELGLKVGGTDAFFEGTLSKALSFIGNLTAQIFSAGVWGAIKGSYLLLKLGYGIYKVVNHFIDELPFKVGQLMGIGIRAASTFIFGNKRKLRKIR